MDELEDASSEGENSQSQPAQTPPAEEEDRGARVDAAKAFFRAMYAGEEPPASFGQPQQEAQQQSTQTACRNCESMEFSLKEAEQKALEAETLYKRMAADFDNYRRRMERERDESVSLGVKKAAEALVPALDDLDRAMMYLNADTPADKLLESFKLVGNRILQCMEQVGLKPIKAVGEQFDPKFHEPVQQIETTEHPDGAVVNELRKGYMLHDKVVRPTLVNVASNSSGVVEPAASAPAPAAEAPAPAVEQAEPAPAAAESEAPSAVPAPEAPPPAMAEETNERVFDLGDVDV